jgi:hypothetical protein
MSGKNAALREMPSTLTINDEATPACLNEAAQIGIQLRFGRLDQISSGWPEIRAKLTRIAEHSQVSVRESANVRA